MFSSLLVVFLPISLAFPEGCISSPYLYQHAGASLNLIIDDPAPTGLVVPVRGRELLTYSSRPQLPENLTSPKSANFPLVAVVNDTKIASIDEYAAAAKGLFSDRLISHGAVLLRGLPLKDGVDFDKFLAGLGWNISKLSGGGTQRSDVTKVVRTASNEPPEQTIEPHMDMAHSKVHPRRIAFFCLAGPPPGVGGETALTDMRGVYSTLHAQGIPQAFEAHGGVAYRKRLWSADAVNHSYTWQQFFWTEQLEHALVEVRKRDPEATANDQGVIDFQEVLPAVLPHPITSEPTWFNGIHTNHRSYYEEAAHVDTSDGSPMDTTYADGEAISEDTMVAVRAAIWENSVAIGCQTGDLIVVDNMLVSHGRMGWVPGNPRKMLLAHITGDFEHAKQSF